MERELKFRAWIKNRVVGNFMIYQKDKSLGEFFDHTIEGMDYELMQFTGLYDKNKKPIYEGDIIRIHEGSEDFKETRIIWNNEHMRFEPNNKGLRFEVEAAYEDYYEIIGNIYENPELLNNK